MSNKYDDWAFWDSKSRDELLLRWAKLKTELEKVKTLEMELRKYIVKSMFPNSKEGTNNLELGNGYKLKVDIKYNYKIDNEKIDGVLEEIAKTGNEGHVIAERLIKWAPSLSLTEYRNIINKDIKKKIDSILTITDGAPTLSIIEPKTK